MKKVLPHYLSLNHCYSIKLTHRFIKIVPVFCDCKSWKRWRANSVTSPFSSPCKFSLIPKRAQAGHCYPMLAWISHTLYLVEVFLAVILEVFWVDVYLVLVHPVRSGIFCRFLHKLLNFHCRLMLLYIMEWLDWNKGWSYTVFKRKKEILITYWVWFYCLTTMKK